MTDYSDVIDRRRFLELAGVSGAAALAGCGDDGGDGSSGGTDGSDGSDGDADGSDGSDGEDGSGAQVYDATHLCKTDRVPANMQFNRQNPNSFSDLSHELLFDELVKFNYARGDFEPYAVQDWEFTGDTFEMRLREGLTWDDGDPVTSEDLATQLRLNRFTSGSLWDYTESIDTPDERTVVLNIEGDVNPTIIEFDVLEDTFLHQKADVFGGFLEMYEDGDEDEAIRQLQEFAYRDVAANGPFSLESAGQQQLRMTRRDDHPDAGNVNYSSFAMQYLDGNQAAHQALINLEVDSAHTLFVPPEVVDQMPDDVQMETIPGKWGYGLAPNHGHEHLGDRAVRQAIQYVVDRETVVQNVGDSLKEAPPLPVAIPSADQERWLGDAVDEFESYGADEAMHDEAQAVLEEAGYALEDGTVVDADGNAVEVPITVPQGWSDWVTATETIVDQLTAFGFDATVDSRSWDTLASTAYPNGEFTMAAAPWIPGGGRAAFPYFSLQQQLLENDTVSFNYPSLIESQGGSEGDVTVPDVDGEEMTVNPSDRLEELSQTTDEEAVQEIVTELAWVTNVDLPMIPVMEKLEQTFLTTDEWTVPEPGSPAFQVKWANAWLTKQGDLQYSGE